MKLLPWPDCMNAFAMIFWCDSQNVKKSTCNAYLISIVSSVLLGVQALEA